MPPGPPCVLPAGSSPGLPRRLPLLPWCAALVLVLAACGGDTGGQGLDDDDSSGLSPTTPPGDDESPAGDDESPAGDDESPAGDDESPAGDDESPVDLNSSFRILGSFPQDGAMAVPVDLQIEVFFSEPYLGEAADLHATLEGSGAAPLPLANFVLGADRLSALFPVSLNLWTGSAPYTFRLEVAAGRYLEAPLSFETTFSTALACGVTFDVYAGLEFVEIGDSAELVRLLNSWLEEPEAEMYTAFMLERIAPFQTFPAGPFYAGIAAVQPLSDTLYGLDPALGVTTRVAGCQIDAAGDLHAEADRTVFPITLPGTPLLYLYVDEAVFSAHLSASGDLTAMTDFRLEGRVGEAEIALLFTEAGYPELIDRVKLDVDSDGDGEEDAARLELRSQPVPITLGECSSGTTVP